MDEDVRVWFKFMVAGWYAFAIWCAIDTFRPLLNELTISGGNMNSEKDQAFGYRLRDDEKVVMKSDHAIVYKGEKPSKLVLQDGKVIPANP